MEQIKTLLLRFRDLVTGQGKTIKEHASIAQANNLVWWGWWAKQNEQVPLEVFAELLKKISQDGGIDIYLIDTGQSLLYKARCIDIKYDISRNKILSPNPALTPSYYKEEPYKAWFCLSSIDIDPVKESTINGCSYVDVPAFFIDSSITNYTAFEKKRVSSLQELRLQDRSIWFVRDAHSTDLNHEIQLTSNNKLQPTHFTKEFKNTSSHRLLWLTDIHFGSSHGFIQSPTPVNQERSLWLSIKDTCEKAKIENIGGVIVSGDITTHSEQVGFDNAYDLLFSSICSDWTENDFYNWIICPGNHDFGFASTPLVKGDPIGQPIEAFTDKYSHFYNRLFNLQPNKFFCSGRRFLIGNTYPVEIIALNSLHLQQTAGEFQGYGYVGHEQLEFAEKQYGWAANTDKKRKPIRIVVLHHHILPISYTESTKAGGRYSLTLDAESLTRWMLKNDVKVVLHGHMHQPAISQISRPITIEDKSTTDWSNLTVCSLGSGGVKQELLGEIGKNMFGILSFDNDELQIEFYQIKSNIKATGDELIFKACLPI